MDISIVNCYDMFFAGMKTKLAALFALLCISVTVSASAGLSYAGQDTADVASEDVIVPPEYDGGMEKMYQFILDNFEYPEDCEKRHVSGTIEIQFTIEKSGDISSIIVLEGLEDLVDEELVRVFKAMPLWKPATKNGIPARYTVVMPVTLKISRKRVGDKSNWQL